MDIGKKIRMLRKKKGFTLRELSKSCGVDLATLSRIETGKMTGTVNAHQAIASSLGLNLAQLYGNMSISAKPVTFKLKDNRTDIFVYNEKASYDMLTTGILSKKMMPVMIRLARGGQTQAEEFLQETERFIYILKGKCKIYVGHKSHILKENESLYFDASLRHLLKNIGKDEVRAISVITPPAL